MKRSPEELQISLDGYAPSKQKASSETGSENITLFFPERPFTERGWFLGEK
jgi:hypothetical protein